MRNTYRSVLFVEESETDQLIARKIMQITGFASDVTIRDSGQSALDFLENAIHQAVTLPELIFLDMRFPEIDGLSFLDAFEELPATVKGNCKIIILTDLDSREHIRKISDYSYIKKVLPKPLTVETILKLHI